jgi:hypothetical protein
MFEPTTAAPGDLYNQCRGCVYIRPALVSMFTQTLVQ